ncbi:serine/threonine-protein kinase [Lignipirellula cremea]|uniref:Serine/threonine-protein kinase PknB n=1 Tax=Lignipirellula cremea TaxID=2528010 RepID=A0A518E2A6_9BACT|nr:serine/threonine-protein kinase [Lignipirellula cremea]QDU98192.1 Serine/threonine-protein kinase PknB [Lignipirellula cremea]
MAPESKTSRSLFRQSALASGLVTRSEMEAALAAVASKATGAPAHASDEDLAARLIELELLTVYQTEQLKQGRTKLRLGQYRITEFIYQGGMGQVFKAVHEVLGRESAVKVLPLAKATEEARRNFVREVRTQAKLDHPHLVRAYDAGEDGSVNYLVVEYVPGTDLRRLVRSQKKLSMQQAASIIRQAAQGLQYAHDCGLIHRDVKPGNILVTPEGVAKVSDLGLAGFITEADEDPRAGKIVGTADYLAPEQIRTPGDITFLIDIYSLGCTLYYAITGKVPYPGGSPSNKAFRHCHETPWHPRRFNSDVSEEFVEIIADMMDKNPADRVQSMGEVAARLEPFVGDTGPILSQQITKSPWTPAPPPAGEESLNPHDTGSGEFDVDNPSQGSQATERVGAWSQATDKVNLSRAATPPALPARRKGLSTTAIITTTLAIAVPIATLLGALIGFGIGVLMMSQ